MTTWVKIKFYYDTMLGSTGSTLTASSTATGDYSAAYLYNMLETNMWKAANTADQHINYDAGVGNTRTADYVVILGHNIRTTGCLIGLQCSSDNFATDIVNCFTDFIPTNDGVNAVILKEFTAPPAKRYWRLNLSGSPFSAVPYMTLCLWGLKTELDYATASFDPYQQEVKANTNLSQGGYVAGVHAQYTERQLSLTFEDADATLYGLVKTWWQTSGLKNFFVAWETANNPNDVYLMRPDTKFSNPLTNGGLYRNITINLTGRKE